MSWKAQIQCLAYFVLAQTTAFLSDVWGSYQLLGKLHMSDTRCVYSWLLAATFLQPLLS
jgi:hypothetical protein